MSTYTFTQKASPSEPQQESNFGNLSNDASRNAMTIGSGPQTADITATPVVSPVSILSTGVTTLNVPLNAIQVNFLPTTNTINVSEADPTVATKYFTVPAGIQTSVDVSRTAVLYIKANTGTTVTSFYFNVV